jgi:hypothetical protein
LEKAYLSGWFSNLAVLARSSRMLSFVSIRKESGRIGEPEGWWVVKRKEGKRGPGVRRV